MNIGIQVFRRYAVEHIDLRRPGFALADEQGRTIGHLDLVALQGNRIRVEGWCDAPLVALVTGGARVETVPNLLRRDVSAARGDAAGQTPGFRLDAPVMPGPSLLSVEFGTTRYIHPLGRFTPAEIRAARLRLVWPFLRDLAGAAPAALRWLISRDPAAKARIKRALRFSANRMPVSVMNSGLFAQDGTAAPPEPAGLFQTPITIVLPVYNAFDLLAEVLERVLAHTDLPWRLVMVEDCSSDARVRPFLRDWVAAQEAGAPGRVTLVENATNMGFIRSVNAALDLARGFGDHVVLLNSDAFVPAGWASRLIRPFLVHSDVASVTPMSNDAEIFSTPVICQRTVLAPGAADAIDATARRFHPDADLAQAPTGVGFCMALNRRYLALVPQLDTVFGRGYGEEVDWCQKVRARGGRHLALPGLFVEHRGGTSFGSAEKLKLIEANNAVISRRYPDYDQQVQDFIRHDPLLTPRLALAIAWAAAHQPAGLPMPVYLAHSLGGGAENYLQRRIAGDLAGGAGQGGAEAGGSAIVLRIGGPFRWRVELYTAAGVTGGGTHDFALVARLLEPVAARRVVYSCGVGDSDPVTLPGHLLALAAGPDHRLEVLIHDFYPVSPSYTLLNDQGLHTGLPAPDAPDAVHRSRRPDGARVTLAEWQAEWGRLLAAADEITVFSEDSRRLVAGAYPAAAGALVLRPHRLLADVPRVTPPPAGARPVIGVLGNIGYQKGAALLADLSRELAQSRAADLVVVGNLDPAYALAPPAIVHGNYRLPDIPDLVARYGIGCWLIPSVWPETFSYATHEALATGLPVWCFDLGAQAEAVGPHAQASGQGGVIALNRSRPDIPALIRTITHRPTHEDA
nr:glycosyltransferase [Fertoeibacter niger]